MELLEPLDYSSREARRREARLCELRERLNIALPASTFTIRSILEWMSLPIDNNSLYWESEGFFEPLREGPGFEYDISTCVYKHVVARLTVTHADLYLEERLEQIAIETMRNAGLNASGPMERLLSPTITHGVSGLDKGRYDNGKFSKEVREGWVTEAVSLASNELSEQATDKTADDLANEVVQLIDSGKTAYFDHPDTVLGEMTYPHGGRLIVEPTPGLRNCAAITNAVRQATGLSTFKYCPIGKVGSAPKRDRWQHCPSICAERSALLQWKEISANRLIKEPLWADMVQKTMLTTAVPCYFCAMGIGHEALLDTVIIGGIHQRPDPPWLNTDDEIALDILAKTVGTRGGTVRFYDGRGAIEYLKHLEANADGLS